MKNPLKDFFTPRAVVGLEVTPRFIGAVKVMNTLKGVELTHASYKEVKDSENLEGELNEVFQNGNLEHEILISCLPGTSAVVREVSVPFKKVGKLDKVIKYQLEPYVPLPIEDVLVDFLHPDSSESLTTFGVPKRALAEHLSRLAAGGLKPNIVTLDDLGLFTLGLYVLKEDLEGPIAIVRVEREEICVQVIHHRKLDFMRILPGGMKPADRILESFKIYRLGHPDDELREIYLVGDGAVEEDLSRKIYAGTGIEVMPWRPFDGISHKLGDIDPQIQSRLSVPLGLALSMSGTLPKVVNLRKEEFRITSALDLKRMLAAMLSVTLLLVCLFTFHLYQKVHIQEARYKALTGEMRAAFVQTFPQARRIVKGRELFQMKQKIEEESAKFQWAQNLATQGTVLEVLRELTAVTAPFPDVKIDNISVEQGEIRIDGSASSFENVDRLKEKLSASKSFEGVKLTGAKADKKANVVRFNFGLERKP